MRKITVRSCILQIYTLFFLLLFLLLYPLLVLSFCPIYALRFVVSILKQIFRPDLDKMVVTRSAILAMDNPYKSPRWNLVVWLILEGNNTDVPNFATCFNDDIIHQQLPNGKYTDPEFQQYYHKWLGFLFWKWDPDFNVKNHIRSYFDSEYTAEGRLRVVTETDFRGILKKLAWAPFTARRSPWEFLHFRNYDDGSGDPYKFVAIFRVHHGFSDGYAILRLLLQKLCGVSMESSSVIAKPETFQKKSLREKIGRWAVFPILGPYHFVRMLVHAYDRNEWHKIKDKDLSFPFNFAFSQKIPLAVIKNVKDLYGVSFTAVVMSAIAGGIRRTMIRQGAIVPRSINAGVPIPMPGHPTKMRNHFIFSFLKLPTGIANPIRRLKKTEKNVAALKASHAPLFGFYTIPVAGGVFYWLMKYLNRNPFSTAVISNFPGPTTEGKFFAAGTQHTLTDLNFVGGLGSGNVGFGVSILSFADSFRICTEGDQNIFPNDAAVQEFNDGILEEIQELQKFGAMVA